MKVSKVVFNSVSHDARVLKEAISVADLGHDVTIIGIQDANNSRPEEIYDNIKIKRSAWKSQALKPLIWIYLSLSAIIILGAFFFLLITNELVNNYNYIYSYIINNISITKVIGLIISLYVLKNLVSIYIQYKKRKRIYSTAKNMEKNESLKYHANNDVINDNDGKKLKKKKEIIVNKKESFLKYNYPRPIMAGLNKIFDTRSRKTWKTVFAREKTIYKILCEEKPDVVHAHDVSALPVCAKYKRTHGCKLVFDAHEMYDHLAQSEADMATVNKKVMQKYSTDVDLFITINESIANYYKNNYNFPKALVVKNATYLADDVEYDGRLHNEAGIDRDRKILLYQGGFAPKRGLLSLLMAAEYLDDNWTLVFMGWGNLTKDMKLLSSTLIQKNSKIANKIKFVPKVKQKELPFWTSGAALGVIPYENTSLNHWFCTPNKLWEYPNAGIPIIASPFPEMEKIITENEIGWYLPDPLSPKEIANAINSISDEELKLARVKSREFIKKDNWSKYAIRLQNKYGELV